MEGTCVCIAVLHLIFVLLRVYDTTWSLIAYEEAFQISTIKNDLFLIVFQLCTSLSLIYGSIKEDHRYFIPWLVCTFPIFMAASVYSIYYMSSGDTSQILINFLVAAVIWTCWYRILKRTCNLKHNSSYSKVERGDPEIVTSSTFIKRLTIR